MWNRFDSNFWYRFSSRIWYRFGSKLTRFCEKFGTDLVPKFGTVFDSRVPKMLVHVFQKFWHLVSENVEPNGSRWWAGLMTDHGRQAYPLPPHPCAQTVNAEVHAYIYCSLHCRCNLSALQHSIDRFDTRLGQRIAHADDDAIALTARRLPRRKCARCVCVCGQRVSPAVASNRYRAHGTPKRHTSR